MSGFTLCRNRGKHAPVGICDAATQTVPEAIVTSFTDPDFSRRGPASIGAPVPVLRCAVVVEPPVAALAGAVAP